MKNPDEIIKHATESLNTKGINVSREWLIQVVDYVIQLAGVANDLVRLTDKIYELFLDSDLHECYEYEKIPKDVSGVHKKTLFDAKAEVFQVDEVANIGSSLQDKHDKDKKNVDPNAPLFVGGKPLLKLFLTDGVNQVVALDLTGMTVGPNGALKVMAGCKLALKAVEVRRGVLMIHGRCCQILGGDVSRLRSLQSQCKPVSVADAPPQTAAVVTAAPAAVVPTAAVNNRPQMNNSYQSARGTTAPNSSAADDSMTVMEDSQLSESGASVNVSSGSINEQPQQVLHDSHVSFEYEGDSFDYGDYYPSVAATAIYAAALAAVPRGIAYGMLESESIVDDQPSSSGASAIDLITPAKPPVDSTTSTEWDFDSPLPMNITSRRTTTAKKARPPVVPRVETYALDSDSFVESDTSAIEGGGGGGVGLNGESDMDLMIEEEERMRWEQEQQDREWEQIAISPIAAAATGELSGMEVDPDSDITVLPSLQNLPFNNYFSGESDMAPILEKEREWEKNREVFEYELMDELENAQYEAGWYECEEPQEDDHWDERMMLEQERHDKEWVEKIRQEQEKIRRQRLVDLSPRLPLTAELSPMFPVTEEQKVESESEITVLPSQHSPVQYDSYNNDPNGYWDAEMTVPGQPEMGEKEELAAVVVMPDSDITAMQLPPVLTLSQAIESPSVLPPSVFNSEGCVRVQCVFSRVHCFSVEFEPFQYSCLVDLTDAGSSTITTCVAELSSDFCRRFLEVSMEDFMAITDGGDPHSSTAILEMFLQRFVDTQGCFWVRRSASASYINGGLSVGKAPVGEVKLSVIDFAADET